MPDIHEIAKYIWLGLGGFAGWLVGTFEPTIPLLIVAIIFMVYDSVTAYKLSLRIHKAHPDKKPVRPKFTSYLFKKVICVTMWERLGLILLAFLLERWVFIHVSVPASYIVTGVICFEQFWSILENESSCRDGEKSVLWAILQKLTIDKTARHLELDKEELEEILRHNNVTPE